MLPLGGPPLMLAQSLSSPTSLRIALRRPLHARRSLWIALALSILIHAAWSLWPVEPPKSPDDVVLSATLTEMPAPPTPSSTPAPSKTRPKPKRVVPAAPLPPAAPETEASIADGAQKPELFPDPALSSERPLAEIAPEALAPISPGKTLPPRLDLAYKVFLGTQGFLIGEATYRFEHHGDAYRIATVAQARGLAALFIHGKGKVESNGIITPEGLQPHEFVVERGSSDKREVARFDWNSRIVTLNDNTTLPLEAPSFDPMTLMWQAYFTPPESPVQTLNVVTTRRIANYTVAREGTETITWPQGEIETERWHRKSDDGRIDAYFWLAPQMHYVLVKMRVSQTARGTLEALLDTIRVDEPTVE
jgi:uncharacterized protein DUF3108